MAVPTVSSVSPSPVWTGGQVVTVTGTNFRTPTIPSYALAGPYPAPKPSVKVTVDGVEAKNVRVLSATSLMCRVPAHDAGVVAITVQNLDDNGAPISGESATLASAVDYRRPDLAAESDFDRVNQAVILMLRRQLLDNVVQYVHTDWGEEPYEVAGLGKLPALALSLPTVVDGRPFFQGNEDTLADTGATTFERHRKPDTVNLEYQLEGITDATAQWASLLAATRKFFEVNSYVEIQRDAADAGKGTVQFRLRVPVGTSFEDTSSPNKSNVRSFRGRFVVLGVHLEDLAGFPGEQLVETGGTAETITIRTPVKM